MQETMRAKVTSLSKEKLGGLGVNVTAVSPKGELTFNTRSDTSPRIDQVVKVTMEWDA